MSPADENKRWRDTLLLPKTSFPMKAGLVQLEARLLKKWEKEQTYKKQRQASVGKEKFILHDGPPYANGDLHMGTAMNKILKDIVNRSQQMLGKNAFYVPGWDCHGLPIEWKVEENFRKKGKTRNEVGRAVLRKACRSFAEKWINRQRSQFQRLGVWGEWDNPYLTMNKESEAIIAAEIMKFAMSGALYQGLKPVMWSIAEKTALAEAEIEYMEHLSTTLFVRFYLQKMAASIIIWTTTPWTLPANRAIAFSEKISYGLYEIKANKEKIILADALAENVKLAAEIEEWQRIETINPEGLVAQHPLKKLGYDFDIPVLAGNFVTDEAGTGFVHIAPSHGLDDYELANAHNIPTPFMVDDDGRYTKEAFGFEGVSIFNEDGSEGEANNKVISALKQEGALLAKGKLRHDYPHSWRSKTPVIFRATPQWFISMTHNNLRNEALNAINQVSWYPNAAKNRIAAMISNRPDWVISRQRAWGVPITIFVNENGEVLRDEKTNSIIIEAIKKNGSDVWFDTPKEDFLTEIDSSQWEKVEDIVDVWFESGASHAFVLENHPELHSPASLYLEGTDQHRGWFQSSLLEASGTRQKAPYEKVLTHGFLLDNKGKKMSKSGDNAISPNDFVDKKGSDILRLWIASCDYEQDLRFSDEAVETASDAYRKLRNALRFMLGNLASFDNDKISEIDFGEMPELERLMLSYLDHTHQQIKENYAAFNFRNITKLVLNFAVNELSSFYFDVRKDVLYCDPYSSLKRKSCLIVLSHIFTFFTKWLSPILCFTAEEAWSSHYGDTQSVHLEGFDDVSSKWRNPELEKKWETLKDIRKVILGAVEVERQQKNIGSSLEAAPEIYIADKKLFNIAAGVDLAELSITSQWVLHNESPPKNAFFIGGFEGIGVVPKLAQGKKCQRSWKILPEVGLDPNYPDLSARDAAAVAEFEKTKQW